MEQQDPLAQLKDIHLPQAIDWWPPAPGWWLLAAMLLAFICGTLWWIWRRYQAKAYRREATSQLQQIRLRFQQQQDTLQLLSELSVLLKRTSITRYGRDRVAGLVGKEWLQFLDQTGSTQAFTQGDGNALVNQRYRPAPEVDGNELIQIVQNWLNKQS